MSFRQYSEEFLFIRKTSVAIMKKVGMGERATMETKINEEIKECIKYIQEKQGKAFNMELIVRRSVLNVVHSLLLGTRFELNDPQGEYLSEGVLFYLRTLHPILDLFPLVRFLPTFKQLLKNLIPRAMKWKEFLNQEIEECLNRNSEKEIFVTEFLKHSEGKFDKSELYFIIKEFLNGGTDTSSAVLLWALIFLTNNPNIQKRLQKDIDSVVPRERLPSLSDKIPYLEATILEILRIRTIAPLSLPHTTICDTEVAGYFIPRDTQVNIYYSYCLNKLT